MREDNQQQDRPRQKAPKQEMKKNPPLSVNNEVEYQVYLNKLQHLAMNNIPVMMNPDLVSVPQATADVRVRGHFIQIKYNPDSMSHWIVNVMPKMKTMMELSDGDEEVTDMSDEDSINTVLDEMLRRQEAEEQNKPSE